MMTRQITNRHCLRWCSPRQRSPRTAARSAGSAERSPRRVSPPSRSQPARGRRRAYSAASSSPTSRFPWTRRKPRFSRSAFCTSAASPRGPPRGTRTGRRTRTCSRARLTPRWSGPRKSWSFFKGAGWWTARRNESNWWMPSTTKSSRGSTTRTRRCGSAVDSAATSRTEPASTSPPRRVRRANARGKSTPARRRFDGLGPRFSPERSRCPTWAKTERWVCALAWTCLTTDQRRRSARFAASPARPWSSTRMTRMSARGWCLGAASGVRRAASSSFTTTRTGPRAVPCSSLGSRTRSARVPSRSTGGITSWRGTTTKKGSSTASTRTGLWPLLLRTPGTNARSVRSRRNRTTTEGRCTRWTSASSRRWQCARRIPSRRGSRRSRKPACAAVSPGRFQTSTANSRRVNGGFTGSSASRRP